MASCADHKLAKIFFSSSLSLLRGHFLQSYIKGGELAHPTSWLEASGGNFPKSHLSHTVVPSEYYRPSYTEAWNFEHFKTGPNKYIDQHMFKMCIQTNWSFERIQYSTMKDMWIPALPPPWFDRVDQKGINLTIAQKSEKSAIINFWTNFAGLNMRCEL